MKIWIDGYEANVPQRLGSGQVAFELLKALERIDKKNEYTILLPTPPSSDLPRERAGWKYKILKPRRLWTRIALPLALYTTKQRPDIFFTPTHYIPRFSPVKRVVTIFDLSYLFFPTMFRKKDLWQLKNWSKFSIEKSDHIITISNSVKKDILENYRVPKDKVTVAYPGFDHKIFWPITDQTKVKKVLKKYKIYPPYVIYIGTLQPRKNILRLIEAVARIEELRLVIVGKTTGLGRQAWMFEEILKHPQKLGVEDRIIFTGFAPTKELPFLLSGAVAFVLPSLWEGFGIPVIEAMATKTPVIASDVSSLPEAVGEAGLLIKPDSVDQIEQAIRLLLTDKKLRIKLAKLGLVQARKFSWEKMARIVLKAFSSLT